MITDYRPAGRVRGGRAGSCCPSGSRTHSGLWDEQTGNTILTPEEIYSLTGGNP